MYTMQFPLQKMSIEWVMRGSSNNSFDSTTMATSKVQKSHNKYPIMKFGSFGHNSFKYGTYLSSSCPWAVIPVRVLGNCPSLDILLLHICNLGITVFAWSILLWITHRDSSFDWMDFILHVWYYFLHDSWCRTCFLRFISYSIALLLCFPNLDINSLKDSQTIHFAKNDPCFHTSTLRWCLFLNLFIIDWEILQCLIPCLFVTTQTLA